MGGLAAPRAADQCFEAFSVAPYCRGPSPGPQCNETVILQRGSGRNEGIEFAGNWVILQDRCCFQFIVYAGTIRKELRTGNLRKMYNYQTCGRLVIGKQSHVALALPSGEFGRIFNLRATRECLCPPRT
jgi:hypothetical protein